MSTARLYLSSYSKAFIGLIALAVVILLLVLNYIGVLGGIFAQGGNTVEAKFANSATLGTGDLVRVRGVDVGKVKSVTSVPGAHYSLVKMSVNGDAGTLYDNATASIRWRTLLGGAFYVSIDPGTPGHAPLGDAVIGPKQTTTQVELDDITSVFQGSAKTGFQKLPTDLSQALSNPNDLNNLLGSVDTQGGAIATGVGALRGEIKDTDLQDLVVNANSAVNSLNASDNELRNTISGAASTLDDINAESPALKATLAAAPQAEATTDKVLTNLDTTLDLVNPLLAKLQKPSTQLAPTLTALHPVVNDANTLLGHATPLLSSLRTSLPKIAQASDTGVPLINELNPALKQLNDTVLPYFNQIDPATKHTTAELVGPALGGLALAASPEDANGHFIRFPAASGQQAAYLPCQTYLGDSVQGDQLLACNSFTTDLQQLLNYNPSSVAPGTSTAARTSDKKTR